MSGSSSSAEKGIPKAKKKKKKETATQCRIT
jgi:hypothetical protein